MVMGLGRTMARDQTLDHASLVDSGRRWRAPAAMVVGAVVLVAAGCSNSTTPAHKPSSPAVRSVPTSPAVPGTVSATLVLPATVIRSGASLSGRVVVDNRSGRAVHTAGCGAIFQALLTSRTYRPSPGWPTCLEQFTIPTGQTSYKVEIEARVIACSQGTPSPGVPPCTASGPPPLPPGHYAATVFELEHAVPVPAAVPVRVTP
jgi:hypothetical protein